MPPLPSFARLALVAGAAIEQGQSIRGGSGYLAMTLIGLLAQAGHSTCHFMCHFLHQLASSIIQAAYVAFGRVFVGTFKALHAGIMFHARGINYHLYRVWVALGAVYHVASSLAVLGYCFIVWHGGRVPMSAASDSPSGNRLVARSSGIG